MLPACAKHKQKIPQELLGKMATTYDAQDMDGPSAGKLYQGNGHLSLYIYLSSLHCLGRLVTHHPPPPVPFRLTIPYTKPVTNQTRNKCNITADCREGADLQSGADDNGCRSSPLSPIYDLQGSLSSTGGGILIIELADGALLMCLHSHRDSVCSVEDIPRFATPLSLISFSRDRLRRQPPLRTGLCPLHTSFEYQLQPLEGRVV